MGRRIGVLGGTFDPPHLGHLAIARDAYEKASLDEVIFMPTGLPRYKLDTHSISDKADRLQMLELLLRDTPWATVSSMELNREGNTYTADTVEELREKLPGDEIYWIVGSDCLKDMSSWHEPERIFAVVGVIVILRDEDTWESIQPVIEDYKTRYRAQIGVIYGSKYAVSSSEIRERILQGQDVSGFLPESVAWYVQGRGLYTQKLGGFERLKEEMPEQNEPAFRIGNEYLAKYLETHFNPEKLASDLIRFIQDWFFENGKGCTAVVGLSGGKDSTTVATLCKLALGQDRVFGVLMPDHTQSDLDVSKAVAEWLGISYIIVNIGEATDGIRHCIGEAALFTEAGGAEINTETRVMARDGRLVSVTGITESPQMLLNIPPRIRMTTLYAIAQTMNGRVSNNCNRSENYVGYSTLYGDAAGDFSPLHNLTVTEIIKLGEYLQIPSRFIYKLPSDGLSGKTDEDALGFTYEALDTYILTGICEDPAVKEKIDARHRANLFKLRPMAAFTPE
ncbi:MAG: nicotinate-nucleotide adenylyltransferase [Lachnospiraceae bacterium]|nr:nicotinate-nucleotide adenylyltransferase [Lachnospiraceae bacterium]